MNTATLIKKSLPGFKGRANLYELSSPLPDPEEGVAYDYVVVSAIITKRDGLETFIFGADSNGNILTWLELDGSLRGTMNHDVALAAAGYVVSDPIDTTTKEMD